MILLEGELVLHGSNVTVLDVEIELDAEVVKVVEEEAEGRFAKSSISFR